MYLQMYGKFILAVMQVMLWHLNYVAYESVDMKN